MYIPSIIVASATFGSFATFWAAEEFENDVISLKSFTPPTCVFVIDSVTKYISMFYLLIRAKWFRKQQVISQKAFIKSVTNWD